MLRLRRSEPAVLIMVGDRLYLFDCGVGTIRRILEAKLRPEAVNAVFITHLHPDHMLDLVNLMANKVYVAATVSDSPKLPIYGPPGTRHLVDTALAYLDVPYGQFAAEKLITNWPARDLFPVTDLAANGTVFDDGVIKVTTVGNSHYSSMSDAERKRRRSLSFRVETPDGVIVITGDTGPSRDVVALARGADVLITEAMDIDAMSTQLRLLASKGMFRSNQMPLVLNHMAAEHLDLAQVVKLIKESGVGSVILTHLGLESDVPGTRNYAERVQAGVAATVFGGEDLDQYCLVRRSGPKASAMLARCS